MGKGYLIAELRIGGHGLPVCGAKVLIKDKQGKVLHELTTDGDGNTIKIELNAPPASNSLRPGRNNGGLCAPYDVIVPSHNYFKKVTVKNVEVFDGQTSILPIRMAPIVPGDGLACEEIIDLPREHGIELPKRQEPAGWGVETMNERNMPISDVFIPNNVVVHLGGPKSNAPNITTPYKEYIKNVACSEIYPTWPEAALRANIHAIISFTLNRYSTVWYRSRGSGFDITNSAEYDQCYTRGRCIFQNISNIVDEIFNEFIKIGGRREPFFAHYCNGDTTSGRGLSQWGTVKLANQGLTPIEILKNYYPKEIELKESNHFANDVSVYNGNILKKGMKGEPVSHIQKCLNRLSDNFSGIPPIKNPNGYFDDETEKTVKCFHKAFNMPQGNTIGKGCWYQITHAYAASKKSGELLSAGESMGIGTTPPMSAIRVGARSEYVSRLQYMINFISHIYPEVPSVIETGVFSEDTRKSVTEFQHNFGLKADGVAGPDTWCKIYDAYHSIRDNIATPSYPGIELKAGSKGAAVQLMQRCLNELSNHYPSIPEIKADGAFKTDTAKAVMAFQKKCDLSADGVIGRHTWDAICKYYNGIKGKAPVARPSGETAEGRPGNEKPSGYPGTALETGSCGSSVKLMQGYLNTISIKYPAIPQIEADGLFGPDTEGAVKAFQRQFKVGGDKLGVVGKNTWDAISKQYNNINDKKPAEPQTGQPVYPGKGSPGNPAQAPNQSQPNNPDDKPRVVRPPDIPEDEPIVSYPDYPGNIIQVGSRGGSVKLMQEYLQFISSFYPSVPWISVDSIFGGGTKNAVMAFQKQFGLTPDGLIGPNTWDMIVKVYNSVQPNAPGNPLHPVYPGTILQRGSRGDSVRLMQKFLNELSGIYKNIPVIQEDGIFGGATESAVKAFQSKFGLAADGKIGPATWAKIVAMRFSTVKGQLAFDSSMNTADVYSEKYMFDFDYGHNSGYHDKNNNHGHSDNTLGPSHLFLIWGLLKNRRF
ncbi:MAG: peptidoglycan-binding protein [Clostridiales bacterium]|jgi:peptidoglycan hydrolase-like protein with peptidoglycan-binding domain|nr:peptidoglycan-binding protein [Clostridiales bacterium]